MIIDFAQIQLRHERTEERRKLFKIVKKREELSDSSFLKWKRMLPALSKRSAKTRTAKGKRRNLIINEVIIIELLMKL